jgi:glycosyltransferase involved in cell wall biosynthesis
MPDKRMNIVLVAPFRLEGAGGVAIFMRRLHQSLTERGHKVVSLLAGNTDTVRQTYRSGWADVYEVYLRVPFISGSLLKGFLGFWIYLPPSLYSLSRFLHRQKTDVVHVHFATASLVYFAFLRTWFNWKLIVTVHGSDVYNLSRRSWLYRVFLGLVLSRVDSITAVSADLLSTLHSTYPHVCARSSLILNGNPLTVSKFLTPQGESDSSLPESYVLAVGSLIPRKGYDILLRAVLLAKNLGRHLNIVIVGDGPEDLNLKTLAEELGVRDRIFFFGEVPHSEILSFYLRADYFVHPAREEAFGLVLLEAMLCRTAVIATRVNGIPEFINDGETGILVDADDARSLAAAMIRLNEDRDFRVALADRGHEAVTKEYSWDRLTEQYIELYQRSRSGKS